MIRGQSYKLLRLSPCKNPYRQSLSNRVLDAQVILMLLRHLAMHLAIDSKLLILSFELISFCVPTCFHKRILKSCLSVPREKKSPWLRQYQSYISNWYINGKVFTSFLSWENKDFILLRNKTLNWVFLLSCFCLYCAHWLVLSFYP